jgi:hypothetical protein
LAVDHVHLEKALDAVEALQNEFVAGIQLDARLSVDTLGAQFGAKLALWLGSIATRFPRSTDFAL